VKNREAVFRSAGGVVIFAIALLVYHRALSGGFVSDDGFQILQNPWIRDAGSIPGIFGHSLSGFSAHGFQKATYRPMMYAAFVMEYALFGLQPLGWHVVNVLIHGANGVLVFLIFMRLLKAFTDAAGEETLSRLLPAFTAGALFITHPSASEPVSWVSALPELAFTFLVLLALYMEIPKQRTVVAGGAGGAMAAAKAAPGRGPRPLSCVITPLLFLLALLFKETAIVLPAFIIILHILTGGVDKKRVLRLYAGLGAAFALYMAMRVNALGGLLPSSNIHAGLGAGGVVLNAISGFHKAMVLIFWPIKGYPFEIFNAITSPLEPRAVVSMLTVLGFLVFLYILIRKKAHPISLLGVAVMVLPVVPALYTPVITRFDFAPRYVYLSTAGYALLLAFIIRWTFRRGPLRGRLNLGMPVMALSWVVIVSCALASHARTNYWHDNMSLARAGLLGSPKNYYAHFQIANALKRRGGYEAAARHYRAAIRLVEARARIDTQTLRDALLGLGGVELALGRAKEAEAAYRKVIAILPANAMANYQMGYIYQGRGDCRKALYYYAVAAKSFRKAADRRDTFLNMGNCLARLGQYKEAYGAYEKALEAVPGDAMAIRNLLALERRMTARKPPAKPLKNLDNKGRTN